MTDIVERLSSSCRTAYDAGVPHLMAYKDGNGQVGVMSCGDFEDVCDLIAALILDAKRCTSDEGFRRVLWRGVR